MQRVTMSIDRCSKWRGEREKERTNDEGKWGCQSPSLSFVLLCKQKHAGHGWPAVLLTSNRYDVRYVQLVIQTRVNVSSRVMMDECGQFIRQRAFPVLRPVYSMNINKKSLRRHRAGFESSSAKSRDRVEFEMREKTPDEHHEEHEQSESELHQGHFE